MFSGFMVDAWIAATVVALIAGVVGFFTVMRGQAFAAHAIPNGSFAGAAGASLIAVNSLVGLGAFSLLGALGIGLLGRRGRRDVATALGLVVMLGLGALFISRSNQYAPGLTSLLFGEVLGVSRSQLAPTTALAVACLVAVAVLFRPLLLSSVLPEVGETRGLRTLRIELAFLVTLALASTMTVPVVGTLLMFSLMVGPPAAARAFTASPGRAVALSVALALATMWTAIAASYATDYPVGFFVGTASAITYTAGRIWTVHLRG
jgi:zinc/manganese transport system permease protein